MKQKLRTLTRALYILLDDCQWKMTHITVENGYRIIAIFEPKRKRHLTYSCYGIQAKHQYLGVREHRAFHSHRNLGPDNLTCGAKKAGCNWYCEC